MWQVAGRELYDHREDELFPTDFNHGENANLASSANFTDVVANLSRVVRAAFEQ
jgi:hypothetical protein